MNGGMVVWLIDFLDFDDSTQLSTLFCSINALSIQEDENLKNMFLLIDLSYIMMLSLMLIVLL